MWRARRNAPSWAWMRTRMPSTPRCGQSIRTLRLGRPRSSTRSLRASPTTGGTRSGKPTPHGALQTVASDCGNWEDDRSGQQPVEAATNLMGAGVKPAITPLKWHDAEDLRWAVRHWAARIGVKPPQVYLQRMHRKWASVSTAGRLMLNLELLDLPRELGEFVIVHELVPLLAPNHRKGFK